MTYKCMFCLPLLCLTCRVKISADDSLKYFSYFFKKIGFDSQCKLPPEKTVSLHEISKPIFWEKEATDHLLSAEFAMRMVKVKMEKK